MADAAQYKIELVSAESDSGESMVVRGITYKPNNAARRQKHFRPPKKVEKCENLKNFGISVCILLAFSMVLWVSVLSLLLAELFKRTVELQKASARTTVQIDELTNEIQNWHNYSKSIGRDQIQHMAQISTLERELSNVTAHLGKLEKRLVAFEEKTSRPQLFNMVQEQVSTLTSSIAGLSNEVENLKSKLARFRDDGDIRAQALSLLKLNMTNLAKTVSTLNQTMCDARSSIPENRINASTIVAQAIEFIRPEMNVMNESLSKNLRYLMEDQEKDHKLFIELQESLANVSSQVMSLLQSTETWKTAFDNLELKILTIREQLKATHVKQFEKVSRGEKRESTVVSPCDDKSMPRTISTGSYPYKEDPSSTLMVTTPGSPEVDIIQLAASSTKYPDVTSELITKLK